MDVQDNLRQERADHDMAELNEVGDERFPSASTCRRKMAEASWIYPWSTDRETRVADRFPKANIAATDKVGTLVESTYAMRLSISFS